MKSIKKGTLRTWSRRIISFILIISMMLTLIPESAYASKKKAINNDEATYNCGDFEITFEKKASWGFYFNADVTIKNNGDEKLDPWKLQFSFDGEITNIWNADIESNEKDKITISSKSYNSKIKPGKSVNFGFTACGESIHAELPKDVVIPGVDSVKEKEKKKDTEDKKESDVHDNKITKDKKTTEKSFNEQNKTEQNKDENGTSAITDKEKSYMIPEKWSGLNYALFTSGDKKLSLNTCETNIYGDVHSNKGFSYRGTILNIDGRLEAADSIDVKTSSKTDCCKIGKKAEHSAKLEMPDITKELHAYCSENSEIYDKTTHFNKESILIDTPIIVNGSACFNCTTFLGKGIIYAKDSVTYNVSSLATPEDSRVLIASENGNVTLNGSDITLNAVLYAPNGCVNINACRFNLNGRIIAKQVKINGTLININAGQCDFDMLDFMFKPEAELKFSGNKKENRKVIIDIEEVSNTVNIIKEETVWSITKDGSETEDAYAIDEENSNAYHKEMIFREAGIYQVSVTVSTGKTEYTVTKEIVIEKDIEPVAAFSLEQGYYTRGDEGKAVVSIKDNSSSPDGDDIGNRVWSVFYDADNDGDYEDDEMITESDENKTEITVETDKVGKYKVLLFVKETFSDTIPKLISDEAYLTDDTSEYMAESCIFEVVNEAPQARLTVEKEKSADIVFTISNADKDTINTYNEKAEALKGILAQKGVDARIDAVSTSTLTARDTFAWKEYDHYYYEDTYLPTLEKHILYEGDSIKMVGYSCDPMKDFLFVENDDPGTKVFEFDLQRDGTDWHSMEGGGFLFNTSVSEEEDRIKGFCILIAQDGLRLVQIESDYFQGFRNGRFGWIEDAGRRLDTFEINNLYDQHHFKIITTAKTLSVWDGDELIVDNYILPDNDYGYGFGPITSHSSHCCEQCSYFTFSNITMQTITGSSFSDVVAGYDWRPGASHYVINLSDKSVPELSSDEETADLASALIQNEAVFVGIGNENNEGQYQGLLNATECGGIYTEIGNISNTMDEVNDYITGSILSKDYSVGEYLTTDDIISYGGYYQDAEDDPIYEQQWEYEYDPSVFGETAGGSEHIVRKENEPITTFNDTGAYAIRLNVRDNPVGDDDSFDSYRLWSGTEEYEKLVIVHSRPVAYVTADVSENPNDKEHCIVNTSYETYDPDHPSDKKNGIREEYYAYKNVNDAQWTEGKMPNNIAIGETYLVRYQVRDMEGIWSFPATTVVKTGDLLQYQEVEDNTPPDIYITSSKNEAKVGEELTIEGFAKDDHGTKSFKMYVDGEQVLAAFGRFIYTPHNAGSIVVRAEAVDIGDNKSEKEITIPVVDDRDVTPPTAEITSPTTGSELDFNVQIKGTAKDETKLSQYTLSYKKEKDTKYKVFKESDKPVSDDVLGTLDISDFTDGTYEILLTAEDAVGNKSYSSILLYIERGATEGYSLTAEITDVKYNAETDSVDIYGTVSGDGHMSGYTLSYKAEGSEDKIKVSEGTDEVTEGLLGSIKAEGLSTGTYDLSLTVEDTEGNSETADGGFEYTKGESGNTTIEKTEDGNDNGGSSETPGTQESVKKEFGVALSYSTANIGTEVKVQVTIPDNVKEETVKIMKGEELLSEGTKRASFTSDKSGKVTITATAVTDEDEELKASADCTFYNLADKNPPTAAITSPTIDTVLTKPVDFVGSAYDKEDLESWKLEYRMAGEKDYILLNEGTEPVKDGVLGHLDTTMLMNGQYNVKLTVKDQGGNVRRLENDYVVEGELKVGAMHIGFTDITSKMGGTTVSANRIYDSRNKSQGDFGYGWTLGMQGMEVMESNPLSDGYEMVQSGSLFSTAYQMTETVSHDVVVAYGDGTSDRFELTFSPQRQVLVPISEVTLGYRCVTNQKVKLEIIGDTSALVSGTELYFNDEDMYDDLSYKLTTEDNVEVYINKKKGVYKLVDNNGNVIKVDKDGYHSEDGRSITFTRDSEGRITKAADVNGNETSYAYDDKGDLIFVTDSADRTVSFSYDNKHNLMSITDPMGVAVSRNEYDDDGRLIATIDADGNRIEYDHDVDGRIEVVKDRLGNKTVYVYDDKGNVLATTDANGNTTKSTYDSFGTVLTKTDAKGNVTSYSYDDNGNMTGLTDAHGNKLKNTYNSDNQVTSMSTVDDTEILMDYDRNGHLSATTDAGGNVTTYTNDKNGNVTGLADELGTVMSAKYDKDGNVIESTDAAGNRIVNTFDENGNRLTSTSYVETEEGTKERKTIYVYNDADELIQTIDADGNSTSVERNAKGQMTATVDSQGRRTEYSYDSMDNVTQIIYSDGTSEHFEYDAEGRNTKSTDRMGLSVTYTYDKVGNLIKQTDARGNVTSYTYDKNYNLLTVTSPTGGVTSYTYDKLNRNTSVTDDEGNKTSFAYNELSLQTSMTDAKGNVTSYEYDKNGQRTKVIYPDGSYVQTKYDERGRTVWQKDTAGRKTEYTYDGSDRLTKVKQNNGSETSYEYDKNGNLTGVTDANNNTTTYVYDAAGRRVKTVLADGAYSSNEYDTKGTLTSSSDYNGVRTTYEYDDEDRLIKQTTGTDKIEYTYDEYGRITDLVEGESHITYGYNSYGELASKTYENGQKMAYDYDSFGRTEKITVSQDDKVLSSTKYGYDKMDRLTRVVAHDGTATVYTYDANGNRETATFANGEVLTYTYDDLNRLILQKEVDRNGTVIAQYAYTLGEGGEREKVAETGACSNVETTYDYDKAGRLVKEVIEDQLNNDKKILIYVYDAVGNRIEKVEDDKKITYTYNSRNQLISEESQTGKISYAYDANGNILNKTGAGVSVTYSYDVYNRLVEYTDKSNTETYTYDAEGVRRSKKNTAEELVFISDTTGSLSMLLAETDTEGNLIASYTRADTLISQTREGATSTYLYDGHGDVRALLNEAGRITDKYRYTAYGDLIEQTGDTENHFRYTGEYYDGVSDLYYLRARYMSTETGTFISMDTYEGSIYDPDSLHKYLYANGNPVKYNDPSGNSALLMESAIATSINNILNTVQTLHLQGLMSGAVNMAMNSMLGKQGMDLIDSFYEGYQAGLFLGGLLTLVAAINVKIFVVVFLGISIANAAAGITYLIAGVSKKNSKVALVGCALLVTAVASIFGSLGMMTEVFASGDKGSIEFTLDFTDMDNAVIEQGGSGGCFIAGTKIKTYGGEKNIEDIEVGDEVYAYNPDTGEIGLKKVCRIFTHEADDIAHVTIDGETINATTNHPFYVVGYGFKAAGELKVGDKVLLLNGDIKEVTDIEIEHLEEAVMVYNFEVEDWHTYYVSECGVLVHNMCWETSGGSSTNYEVTWNKSINATQEMIEGTNIPKSFTINGQNVNGKEIWVHGNATKHMGEYVNKANGSLMVENELMLSFQDAVSKILPNVQSGRNFFYIDGWEIGINGDTGVIYHALYK